MAVNRSFLEDIINRHHIWLAVINTAESPDLAGAYQRKRFFLTQYFAHSITSGLE